MHRRGSNVTLFPRSLFPAATLGLSFAAACLAGTALVSPALAQEGGGQLPPIEVTSPTLVPTPVNQIASSITVITAADIQRDQRRTVADALQTVPGLNIVQSGGPGSQTSVFMRGTNSNHTKILIDGIDAGDPSTPNGAFDLAHLLTDDIDRIEILRGPQSGLYGSDAIGGVISITTKKGQGPAKITARVEGGSYGTINSSANVSGSEGRFNYSFGVAQFHTGGIPVTPNEALAPGQKRIDDTYKNMTYSTKLGVDINDYLGLNFVGRYTDATLGYTGYNSFFSGPADSQSTSHAKQLFTRSEAVATLFDGQLKNYFGLNFTNQSRDTFDPNGFPNNTNIEGERTKYDWRSVATFVPGQTLVVGAEHDTESFHSSSVTTKENSNRGAYVELQSRFFERLYVVSNVRIDDNDAFGDHTTYRVAPAFIVPGTETKLKASYGTGFKAPTLTQLYDTTYGSNNPNLKPEESRGYDVGFEQPIAHDRIRFGTTYFNNDIRNLIVGDPATFYKYGNIDSAKTSGFETFAAITFNERFKLRFDHTYTEAIDTKTGLDLLRRPRHKMSYTAIWTPLDDLTLSATVLSLSRFDDFPRFGFTRVTVPGATTVNLAANYKVAEGVTAFARIDNLLDKYYVNPDGYLRAGLSVFGGIRLASAPFAR